LLIQTRGAYIENNTITSTNLGVFVRGGNSTGNRIFENVIVGGANPANNLLGICYNPAAGAGTEGPRGDNIYNNHITRFNFGIAISAGSISNIFNENVLASFTGGFRGTGVLTADGGTNISEGNISVIIPSTVLP
jgi:nitrous oxidase accessory protein NosD